MTAGGWAGCLWLEIRVLTGGWAAYSLSKLGKGWKMDGLHLDASAFVMRCFSNLLHDLFSMGEGRVRQSLA